MFNVDFFPVYLPDCKFGFKYRSAVTHTYYSKRYDRYVTVKLGMFSDGATAAIDIDSDCWWFHDVLCNTGKWDDGTKLTNWQCSNVLADIMIEEGRSWFRAQGWKFATFIRGGGEARKNGMIWIIYVN